MKLNEELDGKWFLLSSYIIVLLFSFFPLLFSLPFRIHLDLPYEGAYRLYIGQAPYKDFGIPFGFGFFVIPTLFFYLFGPYFVTLLYGQVFLNIVSGAALISVLSSLKISRPVLFLSVFVYCLSYIFIYFWPWHTHTAFTYGLVAIAFILKFKKEDTLQKQILIMSCAGLFSFLSFFTKQDYGGLNLLFCLILLAYLSYAERSIRALVIFLSAYFGAAIICITPWLSHGFGYWFNHGQPPHSSRLHLFDFLNEIFLGSDWEKFYLLAFLIVLIVYNYNIRTMLADKHKILTFLICLGMIVEALLTKVTSRMSTGTTTYYHAFAVAFTASHLPARLNLARITVLVPVIVFTFLWWSPMYWKYATRLFPMGESKKADAGKKEEKVQAGWELSEFKTLKRVKLPVETIEGMRRLSRMAQFTKTAKVMNMTELTSLPYEFGYTPLTGIPLWYDLGVSIFPKQVNEICTNIRNHSYDVVLFEEVPILDNYFPEEVRETLLKHYRKVDTFRAPRQEDSAFIEVYVKP